MFRATCLVISLAFLAGCNPPVPLAAQGRPPAPQQAPAVQPAPATVKTAREDPPSAAAGTKSEAPAKKSEVEVKRYEIRRDHDPDGIGKFYMGREIAHVMGFQAADWLERTEREEEERLTTLVKELKLKPGMVVADIGAGSGVITLMMAPLVGPEGKVLAVDVQQEMLDLMEKKLKDTKTENVETILGTVKSPRLPHGTVDVAIMVDVYHEFEWPYEMLLGISKGLKPGGRLVFVEYRKEDPKVFIKLVHKMTVEQVRKEAALPEFGLKYKESIESLPQQHMIVFEKQAPKETK